MLFSTLTRHEALGKLPDRRSKRPIEPRSDAIEGLAEVSTAESVLTALREGAARPGDARIGASGIHLDRTGHRRVIHYHADPGQDRREACEPRPPHGGWPRARGSTAWYLVAITITGIGPRSTTPVSETVILRVGGRRGGGGGGGPVKGNAGGKQPGGNRWAASRPPERKASAARSYRRSIVRPAVRASYL